MGLAQGCPNVYGLNKGLPKFFLTLKIRVHSELLSPVQLVDGLLQSAGLTDRVEWRAICVLHKEDRQTAVCREAVLCGAEIKGGPSVCAGDSGVVWLLPHTGGLAVKSTELPSLEQKAKWTLSCARLIHSSTPTHTRRSP
jgi:hypothetical protein